mmetsp:Transcript_40683/g.63674  ORF Transcript_40683/g.63674 Transcript_40683/m.63674 type:complete len:231 (-) Transcript_40683:21-713(-)
MQRGNTWRLSTPVSIEAGFLLLYVEDRALSSSSARNFSGSLGSCLNSLFMATVNLPMRLCSSIYLCRDSDDCLVGGRLAHFPFICTRRLERSPGIDGPVEESHPLCFRSNLCSPGWTPSKGPVVANGVSTSTCSGHVLLPSAQKTNGSLHWLSIRCRLILPALTLTMLPSGIPSDPIIETSKASSHIASAKMLSVVALLPQSSLIQGRPTPFCDAAMLESERRAIQGKSA